MARIGAAGPHREAAESAGISSRDSYQLHEFAERYRLELVKARRIMNEHGSSRDRLDAYMAARAAE
jgi:hypothetical protein